MKSMMIVLLVNVIDISVSEQVFIRSFTLFSPLKCPGKEENMCIADQPNKTIETVSKGQCSVACNRLGWNWFNFYDDGDKRSGIQGVGECQLFNVIPRNVTRLPCCTGYQGESLSVENQLNVSACAQPDINVCLTDNGGCDAHADCTNTVGSRLCSCIEGFTGNGTTCTDITECATNNGYCSSQATCANTVGSRTCTCNAGYTGTGLVCSASHTRLVRGSSQYEGIVEVFHDGQWGTVCDDFFDDTDAGVVCASLGFSRTGTVVGAGRFGQTSQGTDPIWLDDVGCIGNESFIGACAHNGWGVHNCNHGEDMGVVCNP